MFNHLHVHGEHSNLDGMGKYTEIVSRAKELGQNACAITEHGNTDGLLKFQRLCIKEGIKPILGTEFYFKNGYDDKGKVKRGHLICLAMNNEGLQTMFKLQEIAYTEGFYMKPTITMENLKEFNKGLIFTSACIANIIPKCILAGEYINARKYAKQFQDILGDRFYLEIQDNTLMEQHIVNRELVNISKELGIELIATNDTHYVYKDDAEVHEVLLAISMNTKMNDPKRWKFPSNDFWLKSEEEMLNGFTGIERNIVIQACENTVKVASRCNATIEKGHYLPKYPFLEEGVTAYEQIACEVKNGYENKIDPSIDTPEYREALAKELECIDRNGYNDYFLIVQDHIRRSREAGILVGNGRGSASGSKVSYTMDITRIEPNQYNLIFERFLSDGREADIDVDVQDIDAVFELLAEAYGWDKVARIVSFGTLAPRAVTRKILSIYNLIPSWEISRICNLLPKTPDLQWKHVLMNNGYISEMEKHPKEWKAIKRLQGNISNTSMHAGGVIIWDKLSDVLPVKCILNAEGKRIKRVVCFDMDDLHELGHFKLDILGLNTLEVQDDCLKNIKEIHGVNLDIDSIDYEDENVINLIASGDLLGIFQLSEQVERVKEHAPKNFRDVIAINSLIRPGSAPAYFDKRKGLIPWSIHELQKPYLEETYGEYVYQEQYLLDVHIFAGWTMDYADRNTRKNKDIRTDKVNELKFITDCAIIGILTESEAIEMWERICETVSGGYGFPKGHSACYSRIAFKSAYMKYYYPECFYSALLTKNGDDQIKVGEIINECKRKNINIFPPSINEGTGEFLPTDGGIRYRLNTIKGVGDSALKELIRLRPINGLLDLLTRRNKSQLKSNNITSLIKAGVFDFEEPDRSKVMLEFELFERKPKQVKENFQPTITYNKAKWEFESLGLFLTAHALDNYAFRPISVFNENTECLVAGIVTSKKVFQDKNGKNMAFINISNQYETIKLVCFASTWSAVMDSNTEEDYIVYVKGKKQGTSCLVNKLELIDKF
jgi:DNA polymerase-3 subunit alpha